MREASKLCPVWPFDCTIITFTSFCLSHSVSYSGAENHTHRTTKRNDTTLISLKCSFLL